MSTRQSRYTRFIHRMPSLGLAIFHSAAAVFCLFLLTQSSFYLGLLRIGLETTVWHPVLSWWAVVLGVVLLLSVTVLAVDEARRTVRRWRTGDPEPDLLLRLRVVCYLALTCIVTSALFWSIPEGVTGPFRLRIPILGWVTAALGYGSFAVWYLMLPWFRRALPLRIRRGTDTIAMNLALILVLSEASLRVLAGFWASPLLVTQSMPSQVRRESNRLPPGTMWHGYPMNSGGHYDTEFDVNSAIPGPLVVSIGDSFSYGYVPHPYHFTTVAEGLLPHVQIYNMGYSGIGPSDYLHLLEQVALPLQPDLIVVQLFVGNDLTEGYASGGPARWYDADSYLLATLWHRLRLISRSEISDEGRVIAKTPYPSREALLSAMPHIKDPINDVQSLTEEAFLDIEVRNAKSILLPAPGVYERFFEELAKIERMAGDIPLKFVLIPEEFQVEDHVWEAVASRIGQPVERDLPQRKIVEWMKARDRPVLDLLPLLRSVEPLKDGRLHVYHLHNMHFNARGNEVAGIALAAFVKEVLADEPDEPTVQHASEHAATENTSPQGEMSSDQATVILQEFGTLVASVGLNGSHVFDESLLKHPKGEIISAIVTILNGEIAADQKAFAREAAAVLAFFQPGAGEAGVAIDSMRSDQHTWRSVVEADMQKINQEVASRTQGG